jgi:ribonuclease R
VRDADEARAQGRGAAGKSTGKGATRPPAKKRMPKTAVEALEDVRQTDRDVKQSRKAVVAALQPVRTARKAATKAAKKTAAKPATRKRR